MRARQPYKMSMADLRLACKLLKTVEVVGANSALPSGGVAKGTERLIGRDFAGVIQVDVAGKTTAANVDKFFSAYQLCVARGILKPQKETNGQD